MLGGGFPFEDAPISKEKAEKPKNSNTAASKVSERELNPVIRAQAEGSDVNTTAKPARSAQSLDWTAVLVKRAVALIESGEQSLEEVACNRFGSVEAFKEAVKSVEAYKRIKINIKFPLAASSQGKGNLNDSTAPKMTEKSTSATSAPAEPSTTIDVNKLTALKMKAELRGDFESARKYEEQIQAASKAASDPRKVTLLPTEAYNKRRADDDMTIAEMVRHEKLASSREFDREFESRIAGNKRFKDDLESLDEQVASKMSTSNLKFNKLDSSAALKDYQQAEKIAAECRFCVDSQKFKNEGGSKWIIARGQYCYLAVPKFRSIHPLHCLIVPFAHCCSFMDCREFEDEIWEEARNFKKCLLQMAAAQNRSFVFMECVTKANDARRHAFIDCVPTPRNMTTDDVRSHFYKALQDADDEWSQNKRILDTSLKGGLRSSLPRRQFPYFYADFRLDQGLAQVIEDVERFGGADFGRDLMASLLGVPRAEWRAQRSKPDDCAYFAQKFKPFDWTRQLEEQ